MSISVFISSTSRDLLDHRAAVAKALRYGGYHAIDMADFMARPEGATTACLKEVAESDLFVGIYAWRYGYIPAGATVSITEQEYIEAERLRKPCFIFMVDENYGWPDQFKEGGDSARLLAEFKSRLDLKLVRTTFTTPDDLASKVLASLNRWERDNPQQAAVQPTAAPTPRPGTGGINISDISGGIIKSGNIVTGTAGGDIVEGDKAGGDVVSGDKITAGGDVIGRDKITGVTAGQDAALAELQTALSKWQREIEAKINALPNLDDEEKEDLKKNVERVAQESVKGQAAEPARLERWLNTIGAMAPDILDVTAATLQNPFKGVGLVMQKISDRIKLERQQQPS
jgi:hypothetical protein